MNPIQLNALDQKACAYAAKSMDKRMETFDTWLKVRQAFMAGYLLAREEHKNKEEHQNGKTTNEPSTAI